MADINKIIGVQIDDNASAGLNNIDKNLTKVTQSTKNLTQETKSNTQSVLDNGGAMGILNELTGGLAMTFKDASEAIGLAGGSLKGLKGAIIATGIGALVIILGELISNWDEWSGAIDGSTDKLKENKDSLADLNFEIEKYNELSNYGIEVAQLQGESEEDVYNKRILAIKGLIELKQREKQLAEEDYRIQLVRDRDSEETENARLQRNKLSLEILKLENSARLEYYRYQAKLASDADKQQEESTKKQLANIEKIKQKQIELLKDSTKLLDDANKGLLEWEEKYGLLSFDSDVLKNITDTQKEFEKFIDSAQSAADKITELEGLAYLTPEQKEQLRLLTEQYNLIYDSDRYDRIIEKIEEYNLKLDDNIENNIAVNDEEYKRKNNLKELNNELILLSNTIDENENTSDLEKQLSLVEKIGDKRKEIIIQEREQGKGVIQERLVELQKQLKESEDEWKRLKDDVNAGDLGLEMQNRLYDQIRAIKQEIINTTSDLNQYQIETNQSVFDISLNQWMDYEDARIEYTRYANESMQLSNIEYWDSLAILSQNTMGFLQLMQQENVTSSEDWYHGLLLLEKGLAIANVVTSTIAQNSDLKQKAGKYTTDAIAAGAMASVDPRWVPVAAGLASAAGKTLAQIPINWGIAALSTAGIVSTTLTSWNRGGGAGGGTGGGGAAPQAQFNIVGSSGTNQLAATIGAQQNQPVNAYVVGNDVSTQQSLDRNRINNATFL